tara:strand:- start:1112 stop:1741 length:630 start_codon:yes stop_codon:yes gene_type:complete
MVPGKNLSGFAAQNKSDITTDTRAQRTGFEKELTEHREDLKIQHKAELGNLHQKHGQDLKRIFEECADEHPMVREARVNRCVRNYETHRDALQNVQQRIEMYHEVHSKHQWDKSFPNDPYPSKSNEALIEKRQKELLERAKDPKANKVAIHQELEHDQLVLSFMEGKTDHPTLLKEYSDMLKKHIAESIPSHEVEWEHRNPKAIDIDKD